MECNTREKSVKNRLESVEEIYFKTREIEEEDEEDVDLDSSSSSEEDDHPDQEDDAVKLMDVHITERAKVQTFYAETCKCKLGIGEMACSATLTLDDFIECRNNCNELSSAKLDLVVLGIIHSSLTCNETSISGRVEKNRQTQECATSTTEKGFARKHSSFCIVCNHIGFTAL